MYPSTTFLGKCTTVFVGVLLSWITVTNQDADAVARRLFGASDPIASDELDLQPEASADLILPTVQTRSPSNAEPPMEPTATRDFTPAASRDELQMMESLAPAEGVSRPENDIPTNQGVMEDSAQIDRLSAKLRELGATYLRLEKLVDAQETWFRVRCDLHEGPTKCSFEALGRSPLAAMQAVLRSVSLRPGQRPAGQPGSHRGPA